MKKYVCIVVLLELAGLLHDLGLGRSENEFNELKTALACLLDADVPRLRQTRSIHAFHALPSLQLFTHQASSLKTIVKTKGLITY